VPTIYGKHYRLVRFPTFSTSPQGWVEGEEEVEDGFLESEVVGGRMYTPLLDHRYPVFAVNCVACGAIIGSVHTGQYLPDRESITEIVYEANAEALAGGGCDYQQRVNTEIFKRKLLREHLESWFTVGSSRYFNIVWGERDSKWASKQFTKARRAWRHEAKMSLKYNTLTGFLTYYGFYLLLRGEPQSAKPWTRRRRWGVERDRRNIILRPWLYLSPKAQINGCNGRSSADVYYPRWRCKRPDCLRFDQWWLTCQRWSFPRSRETEEARVLRVPVCDREKLGDAPRIVQYVDFKARLLQRKKHQAKRARAHRRATLTSNLEIIPGDQDVP